MKKIIISIFLLLFLTPLGSSAQSVGQVDANFDVDGNNIINTADALLVLRRSLALDMNGTNWQASANSGDSNCDNLVGVSDALLILKYSLGMSMSGTAWCKQDTGFADGATDIRQFLVISDGSHSLGDNTLVFNNTRDQGSKIVYFNSGSGNNESADYYWWDGSDIIDSVGSRTNPDNGLTYGTDPLNPNEEAIRPFKEMLAQSDDRLRAQKSPAGQNSWRFAGLAGGYPDWFLFKRGQVHDTFDMFFAGGRSESEPMVAAAYGNLSAGRAIIDPKDGGANPLGGHNWGYEKEWLHHVIYSFEIRKGYGYYGTYIADTFAEGGGPVTAFLEDCYWPGLKGNNISYPPQKTTIRRSIVANAYNPDAHSQGYYTAGFKNKVTFDEVIFYKNGYKVDPKTAPDPRRTIFDRNFYQGGGDKMGHTYRNVISADGGSGGPQMRLGGLMENSLIIEGYFYSATHSNSTENDWLVSGGQTGQSAHVKNNVQLILKYPSTNNPDTHGSSDSRAQPGWGYGLQGASFGTVVEGNIISGAMLRDELSEGAMIGEYGFGLSFGQYQYSAEALYSQKNNVFRNNIVYAAKNGINLNGEAQDVQNIRLENNVFAVNTPVNNRASNLNSINQLLIENNRFYTDNTLPSESWMGADNSLAAYDNAKSGENWPDPDRTLKRYVREVLGLTLLDWSDNPYLDASEKQIRISNGEEYDPNGLKTFMAVATNMRHGGADPVPSSGKPSMTADYPWDERFTAIAVVNWIRAGFGMEILD